MWIQLLSLWAALLAPGATPAATDAQAPTLHSFKVKDIHGQPFDFAQLRGKAVLVVNTASQCGFTPQYAGLERLYRTYKDKGLVVVAVPSNDFGGQEPGEPAQIHGFVRDKFEITFPLTDKSRVKGADKSLLYRWLTTAGPKGTQGEVGWNFTKFLIGPNGQLAARFASPIDPMSAEVTAAVEAALPR